MTCMHPCFWDIPPCIYSIIKCNCSLFKGTVRRDFWTPPPPLCFTQFVYPYAEVNFCVMFRFRGDICLCKYLVMSLILRSHLFSSFFANLKRQLHEISSLVFSWFKLILTQNWWYNKSLCKGSRHFSVIFNVYR